MKDRPNNPNLDYYSLPLRADQTLQPLDAAANKDQGKKSEEASAPTDVATKDERSARDSGADRAARRAFSRIGLAVAVMILIWLCLTLALQLAAAWLAPSLLQNVAFLLLSSTLPLILVAEPIAYLIMRSLPTKVPTRTAPIGGAKVALILFMCMGVMIVGSLISNFAMFLFETITGIQAANSVEIIQNAPLWAVLLCTVILAPIFEEIVCRRWVLTRLLPYGELPAVLFSSLVFGVMHGNLFQFLYAFGIGILFSVLYVRTGRLRYCITLHMLVNALGSLVPVFLYSRMDASWIEFLQNGQVAAEQLTQLIENCAPFLLLLWYSMTEYAMGFAGVILLIWAMKQVKLVKNPTDLSLSHASRLAIGSVGGIAFVVVGVAFTILNMGLF